MNRKTLLLALAVVIQIVILTAAPLSKARTRWEGRTVLLKVEPVDPYDVLSGYYVRLAFEISRPNAFPGGVAVGASGVRAAPGTVFAIIEAGPDGVWKPVRLQSAMPASLPDNQAILRGRLQNSWIEYGIESFHFPENLRDVVGTDLRRNAAEARVEVRVDSRGNASLLRLRIADRTYE